MITSLRGLADFISISVIVNLGLKNMPLQGRRNVKFLNVFALAPGRPEKL